MDSSNFAAVRRRLLGWYKRHRRDLPWRRTADPYAIWVSEIMLQQTQVATVVPYYSRFIRAFPDAGALDKAPMRSVLALWSGLGYYRRAENLKSSARILAARYHGRLPEDYETLRQLPGIGEYTAGALLSIAFGKPHPAVDGNVRRVLGRIFRLRSESAINAAAWRIVPRSNAGQFNQSLMELGRTLCTPKNPRCLACPVEKLCAAQKNGCPQEIPTAHRRPASRAVTWPLAIVRCGGKWLLHRRDGNGILARLWELPGVEKSQKEGVRTALERYFHSLEMRPPQMRRLGEITHAITTRRIKAPVFLIDTASADKIYFEGARWRWVAPSALHRYPTSSITRKAAKLLADYEKRNP